MGEKSNIAWTDHTFNPLWGCLEVGPGCDFCYARTWASRMGFDVWGLDSDGKRKPLREFGEKHWNEPLKWNRKAAAKDTRARVFCASMADVFDNAWPDHVRPRLAALIRSTPMLDWQLVTKRIGNAEKMMPEMFPEGVPENVWLVPTMVNQEEFDRDMPKLARINGVRVKGISYEPALGPIDPKGWEKVLNWIIIGGESEQKDGAGKTATPRVFKFSWAQRLIAWGAEHDVAIFTKQVGGVPVDDSTGVPMAYRLDNDRRAGADPSEWPAWLRVREFPSTA